MVTYIGDNAFALIFALALFSLVFTLTSEFERDRKRSARVIYVTVTLLYVVGTPLLSWIQGLVQQSQVEKFRQIAIEVAKGADVHLFSPTDAQRLVEAMEPFSEIPMGVQALPGTVYSFGNPFNEAMKRVMKDEKYIPNFQFGGTFYDDPGPPPAPSDIDIYYTTGDSRGGAIVLARTLNEMGFNAGAYDLNSNRPNAPLATPTIVVRIYHLSAKIPDD